MKGSVVRDGGAYKRRRPTSAAPNSNAVSPNRQQAWDIGGPQGLSGRKVYEPNFERGSTARVRPASAYARSSHLTTNSYNTNSSSALDFCLLGVSKENAELDSALNLFNVSRRNQNGSSRRALPRPSSASYPKSRPEHRNTSQTALLQTVGIDSKLSGQTHHIPHAQADAHPSAVTQSALGSRAEVEAEEDLLIGLQSEFDHNSLAAADDFRPSASAPTTSQSLHGNTGVNVQNVHQGGLGGSTEEIMGHKVGRSEECLGRHSSHFIPIKKLGAGASGTVHLALSKPDGFLWVLKHVALGNKVCGPSSERGGIVAKGEREAVLREVRLMASINSPFLIPYKASFCDKTAPNTTSVFIVMEYAQKGSLADLIRGTKSRGLRLEEKTVWKCMLEVANGLAAIHGHRVIHRDIKPGNILINSEDSFKIADLGIAVNPSLANVQGRLRTGRCGTLGYMAPEVSNDQPYDARADVWSLGIMLYEMASLVLPFPNGTKISPNQNTEAETILGPDGELSKALQRLQLPHTYSDKLNNHVMWALTLDPATRPRATELLETHDSVKKAWDLSLPIPHITQTSSSGPDSRQVYRTPVAPASRANQGSGLGGHRRPSSAPISRASKAGPGNRAHPPPAASKGRLMELELELQLDDDEAEDGESRSNFLDSTNGKVSKALYGTSLSPIMGSPEGKPLAHEQNVHFDPGPSVDQPNKDSLFATGSRPTSATRKRLPMPQNTQISSQSNSRSQAGWAAMASRQEYGPSSSSRIPPSSRVRPASAKAVLHKSAVSAISVKTLDLGQQVDLSNRNRQNSRKANLPTQAPAITPAVKSRNDSSRASGWEEEEDLDRSWDEAVPVAPEWHQNQSAGSPDSSIVGHIAKGSALPYSLGLGEMAIREQIDWEANNQDKLRELPGWNDSPPTSPEPISRTKQTGKTANSSKKASHRMTAADKLVASGAERRLKAALKRILAPTLEGHPGFTLTALSGMLISQLGVPMHKALQRMGPGASTLEAFICQNKADFHLDGDQVTLTLGTTLRGGQDRTIASASTRILSNILTHRRP